MALTHRCLLQNCLGFICGGSSATARKAYLPRWPTWSNVLTCVPWVLLGLRLFLNACHMAVGQNQWYRFHFQAGAPPSLVYFSGDWDVH